MITSRRGDGGATERELEALVRLRVQDSPFAVHSAQGTTWMCFCVLTIRVVK